MDDMYRLFLRGYFEEFRKIIKAEEITFIITIAILFLLHRFSAPASHSRYSSKQLLVTNSCRSDGVVGNILRYKNIVSDD